jgi:D-proline reductase (dithiol) PrdB
MSPRFVSYIDRSREYYAAQGYPMPYRWAENDDAPFAPLSKPLSECRVGLVTTTGLLGPGETPETDAELRPPKATYAAPTDPAPGAMYTRDLSWDKEATHTRDVESFLPIQALQALALEGRLGGLSHRFYGVPTEYSHRRTSAVDAPEVLRLCREDSVDVALLIPI